MRPGARDVPAPASSRGWRAWLPPRPRTALQWLAALTTESCFAAALLLQIVTWTDAARCKGNALTAALLGAALGGALVRSPALPQPLPRVGTWLLLLGLGTVVAVLASP